MKVGLDEAIQAEHPLKNGCEVRIATADGTQYKGRVEHAKGEPENMLTDDEFETKFRYLVGDLLPDERIRDLLDCVNRLEHLDCVSELVQLTIPEKVAV